MCAHVWLQIAAIVRFVLIPAWVACDYANGMFGNDIFVLFLMIVFSISNGYIASLGMMFGPSKVRLAVTALPARFMEAVIVYVAACVVITGGHMVPVAVVTMEASLYFVSYTCARMCRH
jgi:hypothetical protein